MKKIEIGVLIATSMDRIDLLLNRSLNSVLNQSILPHLLVIVDDNEEEIYFSNKCIIERMNLPNVFYIKNTRKRGMSGTGAWNTGIDYLSKKIGVSDYVAILDDDDYWDSSYLKATNSIIKKSEPKAIFSYLKREDCKHPHKFEYEDLNVKNFLVGNPGIQGSNMIFKLSALEEINGFDENLRSCTDRDLMIRFLNEYGIKEIEINPNVLVHHCVGHKTVTSNIEAKKRGLDVFYKKHLKKYNKETLISSLERSKKLFNYSKSDEIIKLFKELKFNG
ncbi:glycosyltransferase family A protein [uncultured Lutibacter sp.]|uniref:glycosyltransferase family 2 protein n=1 Tax=uncultured Lutibacter sp. TaxID=437739 RepID=UPI00261893C2|nr:glycosyltransferase family A protein [uncultured Lutibacter sp.]